MSKDDRIHEQNEHDLIDNFVEGRDQYDMDIDRMVNEGLGGGYIAPHNNGKIEETTTDTMQD